MRESEPTGGCWMQTIVQGEEWSGTQGSLNSLVTWSGLMFELELVPPASHHLAIQYCCPINHRLCITLFYLFRLRSQQICRCDENGAFPLCFQWMIADLPKAEPGLNFLISTVCVMCPGDLIPVQHSAGIGISLLQLVSGWLSAWMWGIPSNRLLLPSKAKWTIS